MSRRWAGGSSREWRRVRQAVLERDAYRCQLKLSCCTGVATQVHHTQPREIVGDNPSHLLSTCMPCNNRVGDPARRDPAPRPGSWW